MSDFTWDYSGEYKLPFHEQADSTLVCRHKDTCVCDDCSVNYCEVISEVEGRHYAIPPQVLAEIEAEAFVFGPTRAK